MDAQGVKGLPNDILWPCVRELLEDASGCSQIEKKHIDRVLFLSDSEETNDNEKGYKSDLQDIEDLTFLLSDRESEVIDDCLCQKLAISQR